MPISNKRQTYVNDLLFIALFVLTICSNWYAYITLYKPTLFYLYNANHYIDVFFIQSNMNYRGFRKEKKMEKWKKVHYEICLAFHALVIQLVFIQLDKIVLDFYMCLEARRSISRIWNGWTTCSASLTNLLVKNSYICIIVS